MLIVVAIVCSNSLHSIGQIEEGGKSVTLPRSNLIAPVGDVSCCVVLGSVQVVEWVNGKGKLKGRGTTWAAYSAGWLDASSKTATR